MNEPSYTKFDRLERERKFRETLESFGFPQVPLQRSKVAAVAGLVLLLIPIYCFLHLKLNISHTEAVAAVLAIGTLLLAFQQWYAARHEASMEKYYERLNLTNERYEALNDVDNYLMYMFMEVDNLEYVIEKYKRGYISEEQAFRALKLFYAHCRGVQQEYRAGGELVPLCKLAYAWVDRGGYINTTRDVVKNVCEEIRGVQAAERQRWIVCGTDRRTVPRKPGHRSTRMTIPGTERTSSGPSPTRSFAQWAGIGLIVAALVVVVSGGQLNSAGRDR